MILLILDYAPSHACLPLARVVAGRMKVADVEARLHAKQAYTAALVLLAHCMWEGGVAAERVAQYRLAKTFHTLVLPEFVSWLRLD